MKESVSYTSKKSNNNTVATSYLKDFGIYPRNQYDYGDVKFPIPFDQVYHNIAYRYVNFGKPNPNLPEYVITGNIPEMKEHMSELLVMTGASSNHGHGSFNLMYSVLLADPFASIIYLDLGLAKDFLKYLKSHFETLHQIQVKMNSDGFLAYRRYNWNSLPKWMNLMSTGKAKRGGYSWKVIPMYDAFTEWKGLFSWQDGGSVIMDGLTRELTLARRYGIFAPPSAGTIRKWTHPDMIQFMKDNQLVTDVNMDGTNCSGGIVYMDYSNSTAREIMRKYVECAWTQKCMAPKAAVHKNHRFDQACLSVLLNYYKIPKSVNINYDYRPSVRNESGNTRQVLANLIIAIQQTYHVKRNDNFCSFALFVSQVFSVIHWCAIPNAAMKSDLQTRGIEELPTLSSIVLETSSSTASPTPSSSKLSEASSSYSPTPLLSKASTELSKLPTPSSTKKHLIFTPDIHDGTRIDLVSSILSLDQSIIFSSNKPRLPRYYRPPYPISTEFNPKNPNKQLVNPRIPVLNRSLPVRYTKESILKQYYHSVRNHYSFAQSDCVVCMFYPSICQFYIPFNKTIVFLPAHRFLLKRCNPQENNKLIKWMFDYPNQILTIAASVYDREYINYFTGRTVPIIYSSSLFAYPQPAKYSPSYQEILVAPFKLKSIPHHNQMKEACRRHQISCRFTLIKSKVGNNWKFQSLYRFKAVIVFPYAMLSYYLNDLMASCIPMFVPSPRFLASLGCVHDYRNSDGHYCKSGFVPPNRSPLTQHPYSPEDGSFEARVYWFQFATFYTNATIQFDSWDDLAAKLSSTDYKAKFLERREENKRMIEHNKKEWNKVFGKIRKGSMPASYDEALKKYNVKSFF